MIYEPSKNPKEALALVSLISILGIIAGIFVFRLFMVFAIVFWMFYTAILSYLQFSKKQKFKPKNMSESLLNPQLRFFIFEFIAVIGLFAVLMHDDYLIGTAVLLAWLLFSINFYRYYRKYRKYE